MSMKDVWGARLQCDGEGRHDSDSHFREPVDVAHDASDACEPEGTPHQLHDMLHQISSPHLRLSECSSGFLLGGTCCRQRWAGRGGQGVHLPSVALGREQRGHGTGHDDSLSQVPPILGPRPARVRQGDHCPQPPDCAQQTKHGTRAGCLVGHIGSPHFSGPTTDKLQTVIRCSTRLSKR